MVGIGMTLSGKIVLRSAGALSFLMLIIIAVLTIPSASATSLSDTTLTWNGHEVTTIAPDEPLNNVRVSFTLSGEDLKECKPMGDSLCEILLSVTDVGSKTLELEDYCDQTGGEGTEDGGELTFSCESPAMTLKTEESSLDYSVSLFVGGALTLQDSGTFSITLDETKPRLTEIKTGYCQGETCFIGSATETVVTGVFEDELTSYEYALVKFKVGSVDAHATECGPRECSASFISPACRDGSEVKIKVTNFYGSEQSREDALNSVIPEAEINAICDAKAPVLESFLVKSSGAVPVVFETAQEMIVEAKLTDQPNGLVTLEIDASELSETDGNITYQCADDGSGSYDCAVAVTNLVAGRHDVEFVFKDAVGNKVVERRAIEVLESRDTRGREIDFFQLVVNDVTPDPMNRVALDLALQNNIDYPVLIDYTLERVRGGNVHVVRQSLDDLDCVWSDTPDDLDNANESNAGLFNVVTSYILKPSADAGEENRFVFTFDVDAADLTDTVYGRCTYDLYVKDKDVFYTQPERETFDFTLHFENAVLGEPGEAFVKEIKHEEEKLTSGYGKTLLKLQSVGKIADQLCSVYGVLNEILSAGSAIEGVGEGLSHVFPALGKATEALGYTIYAPAQGVLAVLGDDSAKAGITAKMAKPSEGKVTKASTAVAYEIMKSGKMSGMAIFREACKIWDCTDAPVLVDSIHDTCGNINEWWGGGNGTIPSQQGRDDICAPSYDKSLLASLGLTGGGICFKGIIYNLGKQQAVHCGYVSCLKEQALYGASIDACKEAKNYKECTGVYDEIFELPIINVFTRSSSLINARVQDAPFEIAMTASNAYCYPGSYSVKTIVTQIAYDVVNAATSGALDALNMVIKLLKKLGVASKVMKPLDSAGGAGQPAIIMKQNLLCHILSATWHMSDFYSIVSNAGSVSMNFEGRNEMCDAALCNEAEQEDGDCDRGSQVTSWLSDAQTYMRLLAASREASVRDPRYGERANGLIKFYSDGMDAMSKAYIGKLLGLEPTDPDYAKKIEQAQKDILAYRAYRKEKGNDVSNSMDAEEFLRDEKGWGGQASSLSEAVTDPIDLTQTSFSVKDGKYVFSGTGFDGKKIDVSLDPSKIDPDIQNLITAVSEGGIVPYAEFSSDVFAIANCKDQACISKQTDKIKEGIEGSKQNLQENGQMTSDDVPPESWQEAFGKFYSNKFYSENPDDWDSVQYITGGYDIMGSIQAYSNLWAKSTEGGGYIDEKERLEIKDQQALIADMCDTRGFLCTFDNDNQITIYGWETDENGEETTDIKEVTLNVGNKVGEKKKDVKKEVFNKAYAALGSFVAKWIADQGYLEDLKLSSMGDWGRERAAQADKMFNPETWKANLCSGNVDFMVDNGPLLDYSQYGGAVLTFAVERRELDANGTADDGSEPMYVYTIVTYIQAPIDEEESDPWEVKYMFKPGNYELSDGRIVASEPGEAVGELRQKVVVESDSGSAAEDPEIAAASELSPGDTIELQTSVAFEKKFDEFCIVFDREFPTFTGQKSFCRPIVESAFDRGSAFEGDGDVFG